MKSQSITIGLFLFMLSTTALAQSDNILENTVVPLPRKADSAEPAERIEPDQNRTPLPYEGYKGISDPHQAKMEWVADHPEEYRKWAEPNGPKVASPNAAQIRSGAAGGSLSPQDAPLTPPQRNIEEPAKPNEQRALPSNYDDKSTNLGAKPKQ